MSVSKYSYYYLVLFGSYFCLGVVVMFLGWFCFCVGMVVFVLPRWFGGLDDVMDVSSRYLLVVGVGGLLRMLGYILR